MQIYYYLLCFFLCLSCLQKGTRKLREDARLPTKKELIEASEKSCNSNNGFIFDSKKQECLTAKDWCIFNKSSEGWKWIGGQCLDPKVQCSLKKDGSSYINGKCLSLEESCKLKGQLWKEGECFSSEDICKTKGYEYLWNSDKKSCDIKDFLSFCKDIDAPHHIKYSINTLATIFQTEGCKELKEKLENTNELDLTFNIDIAGEKISSIAPLSEFVNLTSLKIANNNIDNLDALSKMNQLKYLDASNNIIQSLDGLKKLNKLETLFLGTNKISDLSALSKLTALKYLQLFDNKISDVSSLKNLSNLEMLHINGNLISNISPLKLLLKLKSFDISYNPVSEPGFVKEDSNCPQENNPNFSQEIISFCQE